MKKWTWIISGVMCLTLVTGYANEAQSDNDAKTQESTKTDKKKTIVCFGDSITGHIPGQSYYHQFIKWTDWVQFGLELSHPNRRLFGRIAKNR